MNHIFTIRIKAGIAGQSIDAYLKRAVKMISPSSQPFLFTYALSSIMAAPPLSPVRILTAVVSSDTKILPSPT